MPDLSFSYTCILTNTYILKHVHKLLITHLFLIQPGKRRICTWLQGQYSKYGSQTSTSQKSKERFQDMPNLFLQWLKWESMSSLTTSNLHSNLHDLLAVQKHIGSFSCLNHFHLSNHPQANQFTEENLQQYFGQVNYLLFTLLAKLPGTEDPKWLLKHVQENFYPAWDPQYIPFTTYNIALLSRFQELLGHAKEPLQISPPNQVVSWLHWWILRALFFIKLDDQTQKELESFDVHKQFESSIQISGRICDSHFHLDKLSDNLRVDGITQVANEVNESLATLDFAIANYVYPEMWHWINEQTTYPKVY